MNSFRKASLVGASIVALTALLAACGTGSSGGGGGVTPGTPTPVPTGTATTPPTATPIPTATPALAGVLAIGGSTIANGQVVFSCGCSAQAGLIATDGSGNYLVGPTATAIPASPNPMYTTVPGRNYMVIGFSPTTHAQAWMMQYLGSTPAHNKDLSPSDAAAAAASTYIFYESGNNSDTSFDGWNFLSIQAWATHLRAGSGLTTNESKFLSDVTTTQTMSGPAASLYPTVPVWNPDKISGVQNTTIQNDIKAVHNDGTALDPLLPTPCPLNGNVPACTGTPTP